MYVYFKSHVHGHINISRLSTKVHEFKTAEENEFYDWQIRYLVCPHRQFLYSFLLDSATNPANRDEDWETITKFCEQVNKELEGPQTAIRLLAHKIQSPQEREALYALAVRMFEIILYQENGCQIFDLPLLYL